MLSTLIESLTTLLTFAGLFYYIAALWSARSFIRCRGTALRNQLAQAKPAAAAAWFSGPARLYRANRARPVTVPIRVPVSLSAAVPAPVPVSVPMSRSPPVPFWSAPN